MALKRSVAVLDARVFVADRQYMHDVFLVALNDVDRRTRGKWVVAATGQGPGIDTQQQCGHEHERYGVESRDGRVLPTVAAFTSDAFDPSGWISRESIRRLRDVNRLLQKNR